MSAYSLQQAKDMLAYYVNAEKQVLQGKTITKGDRSWTRENLPEIRKGRQEWADTVRRLSGGRKPGPAVAQF